MKRWCLGLSPVGSDGKACTRVFPTAPKADSLRPVGLSGCCSEKYRFWGAGRPKPQLRIWGRSSKETEVTTHIPAAWESQGCRERGANTSKNEARSQGVCKGQ